MGKKKKDKPATWDGKDNAYDYIEGKFNKSYRAHNANRQSQGVYNDQRQRDFQRYMMTGEKSYGHGGVLSGLADKKIDKLYKKEDAMERKLFEAGIPPSQWQYYANKAGIENMNSKKDAKELIKVYNQDERYQGDGDKDDKKGVEEMVEENTDPNRYYQNEYLSPRLQGVNERLDEEYPTPLYDKADSASRASNAFASDYLGDVVAGLNLHETTKLNLNNAYAYLEKDREEEARQANVDFR